MAKLRPLLLLSFVLLLGCNGEEDPYLNLDEELRIEMRTWVVERDYLLLSDATRRWGVPFEMNEVIFLRGGNTAEISVRFEGGCGMHFFGLYADQTYEGIANFDQPINVKLFLYHFSRDEECAETQEHTLRRVDLSFLHPGRYNLTIESSSDRTAFSIDDYEIR